MFYEMEFRLACREQWKKNALYGAILWGDRDSFKFAYLISAKDNVFTVAKILGVFRVSLSNVPISLGRWCCGCIQSFRCSIASLTLCSFRPNSHLTFSSTSLMGGSIICSDISYLVTNVCSTEYCVLYTGLLSRTGPYGRMHSGYCQGKYKGKVRPRTGHEELEGE